MKQTIAVDIDDVLAANAPAFVACGNRHWGTNLTIEDYDEHWGKMWQLDETALREFADSYHASGEIGKYKHDQAALPVLRELRKTYRLVITTSRRMLVHDETLSWIDQNFPGIFEDIRFAGFYDDANDFRHTATKAELARELGASYIIDDQLKHCIAAAEAGLQALLFGDYPWNRSASLPENVIRVSDWESVGSYFKKKVGIRRG